MVNITLLALSTAFKAFDQRSASVHAGSRSASVPPIDCPLQEQAECKNFEEGHEYEVVKSLCERNETMENALPQKWRNNFTKLINGDHQESISAPAPQDYLHPRPSIHKSLAAAYPLQLMSLKNVSPTLGDQTRGIPNPIMAADTTTFLRGDTSNEQFLFESKQNWFYEPLYSSISSKDENSTGQLLANIEVDECELDKLDSSPETDNLVELCAVLPVSNNTSEQHSLSECEDKPTVPFKEQLYYQPASKRNAHTPLTPESSDGFDADELSDSSETSDYVEIN